MNHCFIPNPAVEFFNTIAPKPSLRAAERRSNLDAPDSCFVWIATAPSAPRDNTRGVFMYEGRPRVAGKLAITPGDFAPLDESRLRARRSA